MQNCTAVELQERIGVMAVRVHADTAALDGDGSWARNGVRSCAHWLSMNIGVNVFTGAEMVRAGHALEQLPVLRAAFAQGRLSFDKIRAVTRVATAADDELWAGVALHASGGQLARICRGVRLAFADDDPRRAGDSLLNRGVRVWWRDDGMLELMGVLPAQEGAVVMAAIEAAALRVAAEERQVPSPDHPELVAERRTQPALRPDALVRMCESWIAAAAEEPVVAPTSQDDGCRFPGCSVPPARTEGHHVRHWYEGGATNLDNLVSPCRFHHRRHHEGGFEIRQAGTGDFAFIATNGRPISPPVREPAAGRPARAGPGP